MSAVFDNNIKQNQRLEVHDILQWLEDDEMVDVENAHMLRMLAVSAEYKKKHPLEIIADRNWVNNKTQQLLTLEVLTQWFAERVELPCVRIDPLKIEVAEVTEIMSYAYAARYNILPIKVDTKTITIVTAQPFEREWRLNFHAFIIKNLNWLFPTLKIYADCCSNFIPSPSLFTVRKRQRILAATCKILNS